MYQERKGKRLKKKKKECCHYILREKYISEDCQHLMERFDKSCAFPSVQEPWCLLNKFKPVTFRILTGCKTRQCKFSVETLVLVILKKLQSLSTVQK